MTNSDEVSAARRFIRHFNPRYWRPKVAQGVIAFLGVVATALGALVLEDVLPNDDGPWGFHPFATTWLRTIAFLAFVGYFVWAFSAAAWRRRTRGSFYYVRLLNRGMPDWHAIAARHEGHDRPVFRSLLRRFDSGPDTVVDIRASVEAFSDQLAELLDGDEPDTLTIVAPNMVFPAALAVGYSAEFPNGTEFQELNPNGTLKFSFSVTDLLAARARDSSAITRPNPLVTFSEWPTALPSGAASDGTPIAWMEIFASDSGGSPGSTFSADIISPARHVSIGRTPQADAHPVHPKLVIGKGTEAIELALDISRMILDLVRAEPRHHVVIVGQMPKSVALATGWLFRKWVEEANSREQRAAEQSLWQSMYPVLFLAGDERPYRLARVRWDQADPVVLLKTPNHE